MACKTCSSLICAGCGPSTPCGAGPGNAPLTDCDYMTNALRGIQGEIDVARRYRQVVGVQPYRVWMVWQQRDRHQVFQDVRRVELVPVTLSDASPLHGVSWQSTIDARRRDGDLLLTSISPNLVTENELKGLHQDKPVPADWRFYYEVQRGPNCPGDTNRPRQRYTPSGVPEFTGTEWIIRVSVQDNSAAPDGTDRTHDAPTSSNAPAFGKLRR